jgi:hypothetical protein
VIKVRSNDINPHDGSVLAYAIQLQLIDAAIRERLVKAIARQELHLLYDKIKTTGGVDVFNDIVRNRNQPIPHQLRQMLAIVFEVECPTLDELPTSLHRMPGYAI